MYLQSLFVQEYENYQNFLSEKFSFGCKIFSIFKYVYFRNNRDEGLFNIL